VVNESQGCWTRAELLAERLARDGGEAWREFVVALHSVAHPILRHEWRRLDRGECYERAEDVAESVFGQVIDKLQREDYRALKAHFRPEALDSDRVADDGAKATQRRRGSFKGYMRTILVRAAIDYQRAHPCFRRARSHTDRPPTSDSPGWVSRDRGGWISFVSVHSDLDAHRDPVTLRLVVEQMLSYLDEASELAKQLCRDARQSDAAHEVYGSIARRFGLWRQTTGDSPDAAGGTDWAAARELVDRGDLYRRAIELEVQGLRQEEIAATLGVSRRVVQKVLDRAKALLRSRFAREDPQSDSPGGSKP
jgi:DNA-directed RNA polymerase specialized sigma24 family protein